MVKKCVDCNVEAKYRIKDTSEYYCEDCADEHFADLAMLIKVEEEISNLKKVLDKSLLNNLERNKEIYEGSSELEKSKENKESMESMESMGNKERKIELNDE